MIEPGAEAEAGAEGVEDIKKRNEAKRIEKQMFEDIYSLLAIPLQILKSYPDVCFHLTEEEVKILLEKVDKFVKKQKFPLETFTQISSKRSIERYVYSFIATKECLYKNPYKFEDELNSLEALKIITLDKKEKKALNEEDAPEDGKIPKEVLDMLENTGKDRARTYKFEFDKSKLKHIPPRQVFPKEFLEQAPFTTEEVKFTSGREMLQAIDNEWHENREKIFLTNLKGYDIEPEIKKTFSKELKDKDSLFTKYPDFLKGAFYIYPNKEWKKIYEDVLSFTKKVEEEFKKYDVGKDLLNEDFEKLPGESVDEKTELFLKWYFESNQEQEKREIVKTCEQIKDGKFSVNLVRMVTAYGARSQNQEKEADTGGMLNMMGFIRSYKEGQTIQEIFNAPTEEASFEIQQQKKVNKDTDSSSYKFYKGFNEQIEKTNETQTIYIKRKEELLQISNELLDKKQFLVEVDTKKKQVEEYLTAFKPYEEAPEKEASEVEVNAQICLCRQFRDKLLYANYANDGFLDIFKDFKEINLEICRFQGEAEITIFKDYLSEWQQYLVSISEKSQQEIDSLTQKKTKIEKAIQEFETNGHTFYCESRGKYCKINGKPNNSGSVEYRLEMEDGFEAETISKVLTKEPADKKIFKSVGGMTVEKGDVTITFGETRDKKLSTKGRILQPQQEKIYEQIQNVNPFTAAINCCKEYINNLEVEEFLKQHHEFCLQNDIHERIKFQEYQRLFVDFEQKLKTEKPIKHILWVAISKAAQSDEAAFKKRLILNQIGTGGGKTTIAAVAAANDSGSNFSLVPRGTAKQAYQDEYFTASCGQNLANVDFENEPNRELVKNALESLKEQEEKTKQYKLALEKQNQFLIQMAPSNFSNVDNIPSKEAITKLENIKQNLIKENEQALLHLEELHLSFRNKNITYRDVQKREKQLAEIYHKITQNKKSLNRQLGIIQQNIQTKQKQAEKDIKIEEDLKKKADKFRIEWKTADDKNQAIINALDPVQTEHPMVKLLGATLHELSTLPSIRCVGELYSSHQFFPHFDVTLNTSPDLQPYHRCIFNFLKDKNKLKEFLEENWGFYATGSARENCETIKCLLSDDLSESDGKIYLGTGDASFGPFVAILIAKHVSRNKAICKYFGLSFPVTENELIKWIHTTDIFALFTAPNSEGQVSIINDIVSWGNNVKRQLTSELQEKVDIINSLEGYLDYKGELLSKDPSNDMCNKNQIVTTALAIAMSSKEHKAKQNLETAKKVAKELEKLNEKSKELLLIDVESTEKIDIVPELDSVAMKHKIQTTKDEIQLTTKKIKEAEEADEPSVLDLHEKLVSLKRKQKFLEMHNAETNLNDDVATIQFLENKEIESNEYSVCGFVDFEGLCAFCKKEKEKEEEDPHIYLQTMRKLFTGRNFNFDEVHSCYNQKPGEIIADFNNRIALQNEVLEACAKYGTLTFATATPNKKMDEFVEKIKTNFDITPQIVTGDLKHRRADATTGSIAIDISTGDEESFARPGQELISSEQFASDMLFSSMEPIALTNCFEGGKISQAFSKKEFDIIIKNIQLLIECIPDDYARLERDLTGFNLESKQAFLSKLRRSYVKKMFQIYHDSGLKDESFFVQTLEKRINLNPSLCGPTLLIGKNMKVMKEFTDKIDMTFIMTEDQQCLLENKFLKHYKEKFNEEKGKSLLELKVYEKAYKALEDGKFQNVKNLFSELLKTERKSTTYFKTVNITKKAVQGLIENILQEMKNGLSEEEKSILQQSDIYKTLLRISNFSEIAKSNILHFSKALNNISIEGQREVYQKKIDLLNQLPKDCLKYLPDMQVNFKDTSILLSYNTLYNGLTDEIQKNEAILLSIKEKVTTFKETLRGKDELSEVQNQLLDKLDEHLLNQTYFEDLNKYVSLNEQLPDEKKALDCNMKKTLFQNHLACELANISSDIPEASSKILLILEEYNDDFEAIEKRIIKDFPRITKVNFQTAITSSYHSAINIRREEYISTDKDETEVAEHFTSFKKAEKPVMPFLTHSYNCLASVSEPSISRVIIDVEDVNWSNEEEVSRVIDDTLQNIGRVGGIRQQKDGPVTEVTLLCSIEAKKNIIPRVMKKIESDKHYNCGPENIHSEVKAKAGHPL